jgi:hypothetical protein
MGLMNVREDKMTKLSPDARRLCCSQCGARAKASCDCDASYIPARLYAAQAVAAHPEKSNRVLAEEIGINETTIRRARKAVAVNAAPGAKRTGKDGKSYPATQPAARVRTIKAKITDHTERKAAPYYQSDKTEKLVTPRKPDTRSQSAKALSEFEYAARTYLPKLNPSDLEKAIELVRELSTDLKKQDGEEKEESPEKMLH